LAPSCLEKMVQLMDAHPEVGLGSCAEIHCAEDGHPLCVQFLFGRDLSVVSGEEMLNRMAAGEGFGGNSSFFLRASTFRATGGYDGKLLYAADYDLAARL